MTLYQTGVLIWALVMCVNGMMLVGATLTGENLAQPFSPGVNITLTTQPNSTSLINGSNAVIGEISNKTGGFIDGLLNPIDTALWLIQGVINFGEFITGTFIWQFMESLGFPSIFVNVMQGIILFFLGITLVHVIGTRSL